MTKIYLASPRKTDKEREMYRAFRNPLESQVEEVWTIGVDVTPKNQEEISKLEWKYIRKCDGVIAIVSQRWGPVDGYLYTYSVNEEISYAYQLGQPTYLFIEKGTLPEGGLKTKANQVWEFKREEIFRENNLSRIMNQIKNDVVRKTKKKVPEDWEDTLPWAGLAAGGASGFLPGFLPLPLRILVRGGIGFLAGNGAREILQEPE
ncbi:hypothetical protein AKJ64_03720 [candidate division MSBL1 archaeon SCGC-AAA259E17]|uniref:DUF4062 domain-containing protein n=1 Tax=candidate division MSBL1 archaeon SCGC-AAA259E17 TaxID=1698263 RepID=A0A133UDE9_9EURY|nr:hypothetical protein AKJ64_03720 [candidate division MSBL1 archaeon SCGC-AAA259E17]